MSFDAIAAVLRMSKRSFFFKPCLLTQPHNFLSRAALSSDFLNGIFFSRRIRWQSSVVEEEPFFPKMTVSQEVSLATGAFTTLGISSLMSERGWKWNMLVVADKWIRLKVKCASCRMYVKSEMAWNFSMSMSFSIWMSFKFSSGTTLAASRLTSEWDSVCKRENVGLWEDVREFARMHEVKDRNNRASGKNFLRFVKIDIEWFQSSVDWISCCDWEDLLLSYLFSDDGVVIEETDHLKTKEMNISSKLRVTRTQQIFLLWEWHWSEVLKAYLVLPLAENSIPLWAKFLSLMIASTVLMSE